MITSDKVKVEVAKMLKDYAENVVFIIEYNKVKARAQREYFLELIKQGFTEEQAIKLTVEMKII